MITMFKINKENLMNASDNGFKIGYVMRHGVGLIYADPNLCDVASRMVGIDFGSELQSVPFNIDPITRLILDDLVKNFESNYTEVINVACYIFNAILQQERVDIRLKKYKEDNLTSKVDQYLAYRRVAEGLE